MGEQARPHQALTCEGPLICYFVNDVNKDIPCAAILHCARCTYIICTGGNINDQAHSGTPIMAEGLAS